LAVIMVIVVLSIVFDRKGELTAATEKLDPRRQVIGVIGFFLLGIYGGFIQAGIGLMVIALMTHLHHLPLARTNYIKVFAAVIYTASAVVTFAIAGKILWMEGLVLATGHAAGAWYGSRWSVKAGDRWVKRVLVAAVLIMVVRLWFF